MPSSPSSSSPILRLGNIPLIYSSRLRCHGEKADQKIRKCIRRARGIHLFLLLAFPHWLMSSCIFARIGTIDSRRFSRLTQNLEIQFNSIQAWNFNLATERRHLCYVYMYVYVCVKREEPPRLDKLYHVDLLKVLTEILPNLPTLFGEILQFPDVRAFADFPL